MDYPLSLNTSDVFDRALSLPPPKTDFFADKRKRQLLVTVPGQKTYVSEKTLRVLPSLAPESLAPLHVVLPINLPYGTIIVEGSGVGARGSDTTHSQHHYFFDEQFPSSNNLFSRLHGFCNQSPSWLAIDLGYVACREHQVAPVVEAFNAFFSEAFQKLAAVSPSSRPPIPPQLSLLVSKRHNFQTPLRRTPALSLPSTPVSWKSLTTRADSSPSLSRVWGSGELKKSVESAVPAERRRSSSDGGFEVTRAVLQALLGSDDEESPKVKKSSDGRSVCSGATPSTQASLSFVKKQQGGIPPIKLRCSGVRLREDHGSGWFLYETPVEACSAQDIWYFNQILSLINAFHSQLKEMRLCQHATMKPFSNNQVAIVILKQEGTGVSDAELERMSTYTCEGIEVCEIRLVRHKLQDKQGHPMFELDPRYNHDIYSRPIAFDHNKQQGRVVFSRGILSKVVNLDNQDDSNKTDTLWAL